MKNINTATIYASSNTNAKISFFSKFKTWFKNTWNNLNDPEKIREANGINRTTESRILENTSLIIAFLWALIVNALVCITSSDADIQSYAAFFSMLSFVLLCWNLGYRKAIVTSEVARVSYIARTKATAVKIYWQIVRIVRNIVRLVLAVIAISIALQYVPELNQKVPALAEISLYIVEFFNNALEMVMAYFA